MKPGMLKKILIPLLMVVVIVGIYLYKKIETTDASDTSVSDAMVKNQETSENTSQERLLAGADFSLRSTVAIDFNQLSQYKLPIIVDYGADACKTCKAMAPVLEKANKNLVRKAFIKFVNVWEYPDAVKNVPVKGIPTQILVNADGSPFVPSESLNNLLHFTMHYDDNTNKHLFTLHQGGLNEEQLSMILAEMGVREND